MPAIKIHSHTGKSIELVSGGEIPFGPSLYSLSINQLSHALVKNMFFNNFCLTADSRYLALVDYRKEGKENYTRLIVLDFNEMTYSIVRESTGMITPLSMNAQIVIYTVENNGIKKELEFPYQKLNWIPLLDEINKSEEFSINVSKIFQQYGYKAKINSESLLLRIRWTKKARFSLYLITGLDFVFLIGFLAGDEVFRLVAGIMILFLSAVIIISVLMHRLFYINATPSSIHKNFLTKRSFSSKEVKKYIIKGEEVLMPRSSKVESYSWYLFIELNNGRCIKLLHFNNHDKQKGSADMEAATQLFQKFIKAEAVYH